MEGEGKRKAEKSRSQGRKRGKYSSKVLQDEIMINQQEASSHLLTIYFLYDIK